MKQTLKVLVLSFIAGISGAYTFEQFQPDEPKPGVQNQLPLQQASNRETYTNALAVTPDFVAASALSTPSVVYIKTASTAYAQQDFFDFFFGGGGTREQKVISSGSGVIFTSDGYIVTNNHVIENATTIEVIHSKRSYVAKLVGTDPSTDLAILKIEGKNLPNAKLGRSKDVQVGEWVLAVGNPFNLESTVTAGIVSAKGRNINILSSQFPIESFIQTDAAINPGNSGGALVNAKGELIGINTAILSRTGSYTGYGFAVPVDIVVKSVNDIIKYGEVQKAFMGAEVTDITSETFKQYNLSDYSGTVVTYVEKGGAAEKLGIRKGDVLVKINTEDINSKSAFDEQLSYYRPGDKVKVTFRQAGKIREGEALLTNREGTTEVLKRETFSIEGLGADLETVSKVERDKLGIENGVRVSNIRSGLMGRLGMEEGFIITAINKRPVTSAKEVVDVLGSMRGRVIVEGIDRRGRGSYYQFSM
ncbi:trypsin-like serine protease [Rhodocytophaga rosea]|uniref:Trypsin-like serine protease n=1 Tax=Rhodocytophaga rosea TaxID=2704465 RepID=A0A6C0GMJ9_9BACT|nr:trypsin-like peptidase domain-containing protein [Rhodocytophaga rosea]QHT69291.1 trypsin-like serine protease [Rhodocytophaga rosea]